MTTDHPAAPLQHSFQNGHQRYGLMFRRGPFHNIYVAEKIYLRYRFCAVMSKKKTSKCVFLRECNIVVSRVVLLYNSVKKPVHLQQMFGVGL